MEGQSCFGHWRVCGYWACSVRTPSSAGINCCSCPVSDLRSGVESALHGRARELLQSLDVGKGWSSCNNELLSKAFLWQTSYLSCVILPR